MSSVKSILLSVAAIAAVVALNYFAPGIGTYLGISTFLVTAVGSVVITVGFSLLSSFINRPQSPSSDAGKINVRIAEAPRWLCAGIARQGGAGVFGEFDSAGNFWYVVIHSDSQLIETVGYYFDDVLITVDSKGLVQTDEFCLDGKKKPYEGSGTKVPYFRIQTTTYTDQNPIPPAIADLQAAFPGKWTSDHLLVGTTYSVITVKSIDVENRYKIYKWSGPFRLGEPAVGILGKWSAPFNPATAGPAFTRNAVLIWAWFRTHRYGRNKPMASINWDRLAEQAAICDQNVIGIAGTQKRYECGISIPDSKERHIAEQEILLSCDAQLVFDDDGRCWPRVGYYYEPTLHLSRNRDILAMESVEAQNGESETQGVIVRYVDPLAKYSAQPAAAWYNPNYYTPGASAQFLTVDILACQNHNQAMRLAKSIGMRSQPVQKIVPTVGLRGLRARQERIININYDNVFAGDYEIVTPVEVSDVGLFCGLGLVPMDRDRFTLLPGEERARPVIDDSEVGAENLSLPTGVSVSTELPQIGVTFDVPMRDDVIYQFQYIKSADLTSGNWIDMVTQMEYAAAYGGVVDYTTDTLVRYRSMLPSGRSTEWSDPITVSGQQTISPATMLTVTGGVGSNAVSWRNPTSADFDHLDVFRGTTTVFNAATDISGPLTGGLGQTQQITDAVAPGTYYYWIKVTSTNNAATALTGPEQGIVT